MSRERLLVAALALALAAANLALHWPLFLNGAQPYRGSIENGYAGFARFFAAHPDMHGWNPYFYCGLPAQNTYLPVVPYLAALLLWLRPDWDALQAYRIVVAGFASLGPTTLFLLAWYESRAKWWSLLAAAGYTLLSPSYNLFEAIDNDRGLLPVPWRLHVMVKYGEGPHNAGLTLAPLALIAVHAAARRGGLARIAAAAVALAVVALTHWIAAFALALACLLLIVTYWRAEDAGPFHLSRIVQAAVLGYMLAAFWLTPNFVRTVAFNWPVDSQNFALQARQKVAVAAIAGILLVVRYAPRWRGRRYLCFVTLGAVLFAAIAESHYGQQADALPEARRYALEMELFVALAVAEWLRAGWTGNRISQGCAACSLLLLAWVGLPQAARLLTSGYRNWDLKPKEQTVEFQMARRLWELAPAGRVYVSGGLRFGLYSWFELAQVSGTFESGLENRTPVDWDYRLRTMKNIPPQLQAAETLRLLRIAGVEYVVVHGARSQEYYRDLVHPARFDAVLEKVAEFGNDKIYRVPFNSLAHYVRPQELPQGWEAPQTAAWVEAMEDANRPKLTVLQDAPSRWRVIGGVVPQGMRILLEMSYHEGWQVSQNGKPIWFERSPTGYMVLHPLAGLPADIRLWFSGSRQQKVGLWVSATAGLMLCWAGVVRLVATRRKRAESNL